MYVGRDAPNHYLKLTARENLRLFAGLHGGETEDPDALLDRVDLQRDSDKLFERRLLRRGWRITALKHVI